MTALGASSRKTSLRKVPLYKQKGFHLFLFALPFLVLIFLAYYLPLTGWINAFFDYRPGIPLANSKFVGFKYFQRLFGDRLGIREFLRVMTNTFGISMVGYIFSPLPVLFAIFLSEMRSNRFKKIIQTTTTLPNFISWVTVYAVAFAIFSVNDGLLNNVLLSLGIISEPVSWLTKSDNLWLKMELWLQWKGLGWNAIIYFAAIAGIDQEIYEAARIDGAGRFQSMWYITIPQLIPTFFVLLILSIGNFLNTGFEQYMLFSNTMTADRLETLDLYVYNQGLLGAQYSYSTAIGMFKSVVGVVLFLSANWLSKKVRGSSIA